MTGLSKLLQNHLAYTAWASDRLLDACAKLTPDELRRDFGTADKSVQGTLIHLLHSERLWLYRILDGKTNSSHQFPANERWDEMIREWKTLNAKWQEWSSNLSDADAEAVLEYTDLKGNTWKQPIWHILLHVVNHSTHHRGQISGFLRASGMTPPSLDFSTFMRNQLSTLS